MSLPHCALLGGHSAPRTWAPDPAEKSPVGKLLVDALEDAVRRGDGHADKYGSEEMKPGESAEVEDEGLEGVGPGGGPRPPQKPVAWLLGHKLLALRRHPATGAVTGVELETTSGATVRANSKTAARERERELAGSRLVRT